ncbi:MAG: c-type cytochrome [Planctomycetota bacterium]|nr:c-type cytochrome [Planctomycetota bacterium]
MLRNFEGQAFAGSRLLLATILLGGCGRQPAAVFSVPNATKELPQLHQKNLQEGLAGLFGTPSHPQFQTIATDESSGETVEESSDQAEATDATESRSGGTVAPSKNLASTNDGKPPYINVALRPYQNPKDLEYGAKVYTSRCAGCHGVSGDGEGPAAAYLQPRPRDYRKGIFKFTSTPYGQKPARQDLVRVIRRGAKGTSMPAFPWMADADLQAVVDYVIYLSCRGQVEGYVLSMAAEYEEDENIDFATEFGDALEIVLPAWKEADSLVVNPLTPEPAYNEQSVATGRALFLKEGCSKCHGEDAKGQTEWLSPLFIAQQKALPEGKRIQINYDEWGQPAPAADITARLPHGGRRPLDIYRRVCTGINGTPMPAFQQQFALDPNKIWHLVHYVQHVIEGGDPLIQAADLGESAVDLPAPSSESTTDKLDVES